MSNSGSIAGKTGKMREDESLDDDDVTCVACQVGLMLMVVAQGLRP